MKKEFDNIKGIKNKLLYILNNSKVNLFSLCYNEKYRELDKLSKNIYHKLFIFDLIKFLIGKYCRGILCYEEI